MAFIDVTTDSKSPIWVNTDSITHFYCPGDPGRTAVGLIGTEYPLTVYMSVPQFVEKLRQSQLA